MICVAGPRLASSLSRPLVAALGVTALVLGAVAFRPAPAEAATCANAIVCENQQPGSDRSEWDIEGSGDPSIQGFATNISVNAGQRVDFKVKTTANSYAIDVYRMGYYQGKGARKVATVSPPAPPQQPNCLTNAPTGLVDCGNWAVSASWNVPSTAVSGIYFAKLRTASGAASHIVFVVRSDASTSDIVFKTSDTTWQAYNAWGGNSLYHGSAPSSDGRAYKVSYNRPFATRGQPGGDGVSNWVFYAEYPMVRWLEANGYDVSYISSIDSDRYGSLIRNHKAFLSVGHDEYWSAGMRANVEAARDAGVHLAFFSGNEVFWKVRWETSIDGSGTAYRTLVCYKETKSPTPIDPADPPIWTGSWRDPTWSPPADGGRPENQLTGTLFTVNRGSAAIQVPYAFSRLRFWRNTPVAGIGSGQTATLGVQTLGYEWDEDPDNGFRPPGLMRLSSTTVDVPEHLLDYGNTYVPATATHNLTLYRAASGALVFGAGTVQWTWGLDTEHDVSPDVGSDTPDPSMRQATVNLFAEMGAQPGSLQPGLVAAGASTDHSLPVSNVTSPSSGATFQSGQAVTVSGTASDSGGGHVAGVEVSADSGTTWHPASGTGNWSYTWTPGPPGTYSIKSRAVDDSGNLELPGAGVSVTVQPRPCPCSLWPASATPANPSSGDTAAVEVGVKFRADYDGYVNGVRFYKGSGNTGTHAGSLWTATGQLLATGTFSSETSSGWQTLTFASPVAITASTTYVASYHTNTGHYAADAGYFGTARDVWPLHGLASGASGGNGVFKYGPGQFPDESYNASNYWVDVVYDTTFSDTVAPVVTTASPTPGATGVPISSTVTATFNKSVVASSISFTVTSPGGQVAGGVGYNDTTKTATFTPSAALAEGTTFTATVSGATDSSGNVMQQPYTWSFTTQGCPCTLWPATATPAQASVVDPQPIELGVRFRSDVGGYITGVRFYKGSANTGPHEGHLWTASGTLLASVQFTGETSSGWQQALFSSPVQITANTIYVASYHTDSGNYAANGGYFASARDSAPLHAPASAAGAPNGVYRYGGSQFPIDTYNATNYWVDVIFSTTSQDTVAPTLTARSPAPNATQVSPATSVTATFSEPVDAASISFTLSGPGGPVAGATSYSATTRTATFQPSASLAQNTTYTATVSGARDSSGNVMSPVSWSFTTVNCPCTIWPASATPATVTVADGNAVELGVKLRPAVNGYIRSIRFYKGPNNTGTHVGSLWTSGGTLLASATFTGETASGWQQVNFTTPVVVTANTTYVASYHTNVGMYSANGGYFATAGAGGFPVVALAAGVDGPNGVYAYGGSSAFPSQSYNSTNYWVDVVFTMT